MHKKIYFTLCLLFGNLAVAQEPVRSSRHLMSKQDIKTLVELTPEKTHELLSLAKKGESHAMLLVAEAYWLGFGGLSASPEDAEKWLKLSIQYGEKEAQPISDFLNFQKVNEDNLLNVTSTLELGWKSLENQGPLKTLDKNVIEALAYTGLPEAEAVLGLLAMNGQIDEDPEIVIDMLNDASQSSSVMALVKIADQYQDGKILERNLELATQLYLKAANLGDARSQLMIAKITLQGRYLEFDLPEVIKWLELSANSNEQEAIVSLENMKKVVNTTIWLEGFRRANEWRKAL